MIAHPNDVVLTAHITNWADQSAARTAWLLACLQRHNTGDWGDLGDLADLTAAENHRALAERDGRVLSRYPVPADLTDPTTGDEAIWIITDDLADTDPLTTILWPSDY
jgi:hypothetical protein